MKSVQLRSYFWSVFHVFDLNTERYRVSLRTQFEYREIRARTNSIFGHFSRSDIYQSNKSTQDTKKASYSRLTHFTTMFPSYRNQITFSAMRLISVWWVQGHSFNTYAKFSEELTFLTTWYAHVRMRIRG